MAGKMKWSTEMLKHFCGEKDIAWLSKMKLVARFWEITDITSFIPFYLEGDAIALYLEMIEEKQYGADIELRLKEVFMEGPFVHMPN